MPGPVDSSRPSIPADSLHGLDPERLMELGSDPVSGSSAEAVTVEAPTAASATVVSGRPFEPPGLDELGRLLPQVQVIELLGAGGMGAVYKARQKGLDRLVAIKVLPPSVGRSPGFAERFMREARALARLNHPNIVAVHDFGQVAAPQGDLFYIVMEYVDGANLRQLIRARTVSAAQALAIVPQVCEALQFAHDEGIVHRDIKPENILIDKRGRVKIADFGLAKLAELTPEDLTLTHANAYMGTPRYMAPEQMEGAHSVDHRADIYSLGVVFYELLTGELPMGRFDPPSRKVSVDVRLDEVVLRTLEKEPARRYQQASAVKTDVEAISSRGTKPPPSRWTAVPLFFRRVVNVALGLVYGIALLAFFSFNLSHSGGSKPTSVMTAGQPDAWFRMTSSPGAFNWSLHIVSWSVLIAVVGLSTLALSRKLELLERGKAHSMWWHYSAWGLLTVMLLVMGGINQYAGGRAPPQAATTQPTTQPATRPAVTGPSGIVPTAVATPEYTAFANGRWVRLFANVQDLRGTAGASLNEEGVVSLDKGAYLGDLDRPLHRDAILRAKVSGRATLYLRNDGTSYNIALNEFGLGLNKWRNETNTNFGTYPTLPQPDFRELAVAVVGNRIIGYLDGRRILDVADSDVKGPGHAGISCWGGKGRFKDVELMLLDDMEVADYLPASFADGQAFLRKFTGTWKTRTTDAERRTDLGGMVRSRMVAGERFLRMDAMTEDGKSIILVTGYDALRNVYPTCAFYSNGDVAEGDKTFDASTQTLTGTLRNRRTGATFTVSSRLLADGSTLTTFAIRDVNGKQVASLSQHAVLVPDATTQPVPVATAPSPEVPELQALQRFVGTWEAKYGMVRLSNGEVITPSGDTSTFSWTLDGRFLQDENSIGDGSSNLGFWTWDPAEQAIRAWYFQPMGNAFTFVTRWNDTTQTFLGKGTNSDGSGMDTVHRFEGTDKYTWHGVAYNHAGKAVAQIESTQVRKK